LLGNPLGSNSSNPFFKWKQQINAFRKSSLSGTKFDIFNTMKKYDVVHSMAGRLLNIFDRCHANQTENKLRPVHNK